MPKDSIQVLRKDASVRSYHSLESLIDALKKSYTPGLRVFYQDVDVTPYFTLHMFCDGVDTNQSAAYLRFSWFYRFPGGIHV